MNRILVIRLSALGDVIFALPALALLRERYPNAEVSWVVEDKAASLLLHRKDLSRIIVYPRKELRRTAGNPLGWPASITLLCRHVGQLRREHYDLALDFQGNLKSGVHTLLARAARKVGFSRGHVKERNDLFTREQVTPPEKAVHRIEKNIALVDPGYTSADIKRPDLQLPVAVVEEAEIAMGSVRRSSGPLMIVHPGTSAFGAYKRWAPEKFGRLARRLRKERGFETLVTWGKDERPLAERVAEAGEEGVTIAPASPSLLHLAAYVQSGTVYVSADSGPLHIANYLGVPCLALFGPKDPALYRPYFPPSRVVRSDVDCSPCTRRTCDAPICMEKLEVEDVYGALCGLLDEAST